MWAVMTGTCSRKLKFGLFDVQRLLIRITGKTDQFGRTNEKLNGTSKV
jgi:hypothetical protein